jgi:uncharacterized protein YkwD
MSTPVSLSAVTAPLTTAFGTVARRVAVLVTALALSLGLMASPQFTKPANAYVSVWSMYAWKMLGAMNVERSWHGLPPLQMNWKLVTSAHRHNLSMAYRNTMSHQLPGEPFFATRISQAGYNWRSAGENIGWNSITNLDALYSLERAMYNEVAPNDGHRANILSRSFRQIGIDVYYDPAHHKMWFTQDFGQPM